MIPQGIVFLFLNSEPTSRYTTKSVMHGRCVAKPTVTAQNITKHWLPHDHKNICVNYLLRVVHRVMAYTPRPNKKPQLFLSYFPPNLANSGQVLYTAVWMNLSQSNVKAVHLAWIVYLNYPMKLTPQNMTLLTSVRCDRFTSCSSRLNMRCRVW